MLYSLADSMTFIFTIFTPVVVVSNDTWISQARELVTIRIKVNGCAFVWRAPLRWKNDFLLKDGPRILEAGTKQKNSRPSLPLSKVLF